MPERSLARRQVALSEKLARKYEALAQLGGTDTRLAIAPHLTLYQVPISVTQLSALDAALTNITTALSTPHLTCIGYAYNEHEGSLEATYEATDWLIALQDRVIAHINPLREGQLLERDSAGNKPSDVLSTASVVGKNVRETGYAEVGDSREGGLFRPHATLNWFEQKTPINIANESLPLPNTLNGRFPSYRGICTRALWYMRTAPRNVSLTIGWLDPPTECRGLL
jgi:hypothetical protein